MLMMRHCWSANKINAFSLWVFKKFPIKQTRPFFGATLYIYILAQAFIRKTVASSPWTDICPKDLVKPNFEIPKLPEVLLSLFYPHSNCLNPKFCFHVAVYTRCLSFLFLCTSSSVSFEPMNIIVSCHFACFRPFSCCLQSLLYSVSTQTIVIFCEDGCQNIAHLQLKAPIFVYCDPLMLGLYIIGLATRHKQDSRLFSQKNKCKQVAVTRIWSTASLCSWLLTKVLLWTVRVSVQL